MTHDNKTITEMFNFNLLHTKQNTKITFIKPIIENKITKNDSVGKLAKHQALKDIKNEQRKNF